jgi:hypothetical protein
MAAGYGQCSADSVAIEPVSSLREYARESARPLVSMAFIAPFLCVYEFGVVLLGPHALRNGVDMWLRRLLELVGFGQYFLLPVLTCSVLLGWHHTRRDQWQMHSRVLTSMLLESIMFALILFGMAHLQRAVCGSFSATAATTAQVWVPTGTLGRIIGYCGAGIYEELLFRMISLPIVASVIHRCGVPWRSSLGWSMVLTSLVFSAAHYEFITAGGYSFDWYSFSFRFGAGLFFAALFVGRGFGIAAGSHAIYDMLVELL